MSHPVTTLADHTLHIVVFGFPAPQGSKRHVGNGILVESGGVHLTTWREDVRLATLRALEETPGWERTYAAVVGHFTFTLPRPRHHYLIRKAGPVLRPDAPRLHAVRPDLDKLLRSTWDALGSAGAYADDARMAQVYAVKTFPGSGPGALDRPGLSLTLTGVTS